MENSTGIGVVLWKLVPLFARSWKMHIPSVFVRYCSSLSIHSAVSKCPEGSFINSKFQFSVVEASKIKVPADALSGEDFPVLQGCEHRAVPLMWWERGSFLGSHGVIWHYSGVTIHTISLSSPAPTESTTRGRGQLNFQWEGANIQTAAHFSLKMFLNDYSTQIFIQPLKQYYPCYP